jgi:hypothetical protein
MKHRLSPGQKIVLVVEVLLDTGERLNLNSGELIVERVNELDSFLLGRDKNDQQVAIPTKPVSITHADFSIWVMGEGSEN